MLHWACRSLGLICCTATVSIASITVSAGSAAPLRSRSGAAAPPKLTQTSEASGDDPPAVSQSSSASTAASTLTRSIQTHEVHRHGCSSGMLAMGIKRPGAHHSSVMSQRRKSSDPALLIDAMRRAMDGSLRKLLSSDLLPALRDHRCTACTMS